MALTTWYSAGTVSVDNGSAIVTGTGTLWGDDAIMPGDLFCDPAQPAVPPQRVKEVTADGTLELWAPWPGTTLAGAAYEIRYVGIIERSTAQTRRLLEELSVVDANGRGLFYRFSTSTTDADPGAGYIRLNNADLTLATAAYIDVTDANGGSVAGEIDTWDESTSLAKGKLWVRGIAQPAAFHSYEVTGSVVDGTGYRKLTLTHVGGSGSFAADDELMVAFARTGDIGEGYITNATVADPTELTALEGETAGYLVFVTDLQTDFGAFSGRSGVVELIAGPDWELVALYTGPQGDQGDQGIPGVQGERGINWQGDYSAGTAYVEDDGVLYNGSSWRALGATTGDAPPTLPTTSNAWWQLLAQKGTDGAGTVASLSGGTGISVDSTDPTVPIIAAIIASQAEAEAGTEAAKLMTPQRTAQAIAELSPEVPSDLYRPSNILGTVSQSSGVPTGAIIERGSNANGEYVRYADGTQICTFRATVSIDITASVFGGFRSGGQSWTYPATFSSAPIVSSNTAELSSFGAIAYPFVSDPTVSATYFFTSVTSQASSISRSIDLVSIGRWF